MSISGIACWAGPRQRSGLLEAWLRFSSSDWTGRTGDRGTGGTGTGDGLKDRYGSDSRWTCVSLKIGREMNWIEGLHKEQWIGSLICQAAALNGFSQMKDLGRYIAENPHDEEEVEGIDLHQQRYPLEGSDMDYLYDESSFAQLLSMELTLEIDGAIFHVPNANASSNVDSQL
ncbi:hypothetical protein DY000_02034824 [Brassica cretica]|uniref:Uncharacterized protein n=1 Tax=Brassica cretica TaxID=69181 RepID=A0ABQ7DPY2_BRACR|nr:hypothetical protein DY000_02034824 [Brassica cretica]